MGLGVTKDWLILARKLQQRYKQIREDWRAFGENKGRTGRDRKAFWRGKKRFGKAGRLLVRKERIRSRKTERGDCYYGVRLSGALREAPEELRSSRDKNTPASARHSANHNLGSDAGTRTGPNMSSPLRWEISCVLARFIQIDLLLSILTTVRVPTGP